VKGQGLYFFEEPIPADDLVPSPDGQWVLAHVQNQLYLLAMPAVGGEAPTVSVGGPSVPLKKITDIGADYFGWADDGKTIAWAIGASYFRQPLSSISFEPPKDEKKEGEKKDTDKKTATPKTPTKIKRFLRRQKKTKRKKRKNRRNSRTGKRCPGNCD